MPPDVDVSSVLVVGRQFGGHIRDVGTVARVERLFDVPSTSGREGASGPAREASSVPSVDPRAPLAARMRPRTLDEYVGQHDVVGQGTTLRALLERDELGSVILWGPPGSGKTSLAAVVANTTDAAWEELSAVSAGVKDVRGVIERARARDGRTVLFIDEIHRFNKSQQDALLPAVEHGWVVLVGATTENPFFELNSPLLSRCRLVRLEPLGDDDVREIVRRALVDPERGYGGRLELTEEAEDHLVAAADGDARTGLVALEAAVEAAGGADVVTTIGRDAVADALTSVRLRYDKAGDAHYDEISAFIKSMRGGDSDAAVYWLLRMLEAGEDPRFLARRMVVFASEDVGLADRSVLPIAVAAFEALDRVGLPEATYNLVHAAIALSVAPKSDSLKRALKAGTAAVREAGNAPVPPHLRDAHYKAAKRLGHGVGYRYPHDYAGAHVAQQYLPDALAGRRLYEPTDHGDEAEVSERVARWRAAEADDVHDPTGTGDAT